MLFAQMGRNLLWMDTVLALTAQHNAQFRDLLEDLVLHGDTQCCDVGVIWSTGMEERALKGC
jgi:hypothetical protein